MQEQEGGDNGGEINEKWGRAKRSSGGLDKREWRQRRGKRVRLG